MNNKLFVGNLSFNTTQDELQASFGEYGTVVEVNLVTDRETGKPRGFGFVTMEDDQEANAAVEGLNGLEMAGRALTVNIAKPREDQGGGGGRGRRDSSGR